MKPILRGHFHQAMFFVTLGACVPLFLRCETTKETFAILIYSVCALTLFGVSAIYHRIYWNPEVRLRWKKMDHASIYLMIAGTFTPIALLGLNENLSTKLLITIWSVAAAGIIQSFFFINLPKILRVGVYLIAGYLILPYFTELKISLGMTNIWLIVAGGLTYSFGAIGYGFKFFNFNPKVFGYHEMFHIFVNCGAILHFIVVSSLINN